MSHKLFFLIATFCTLFYAIASSQMKAVTERGDTIYVYDNGTWRFTAEEEIPLNNELGFLTEELKIDTIATPLKVKESAKNEVNSILGFFKIMYDGLVWERVPPANINPDAEIAFMSTDRSAFAMVISEGIQIGTENVMKIALKNMRDVSNNQVDIVKMEYLMVNGKEVLRGVYDIDLNGMAFTFDAYYFSNENGTIQFSTWTGTNLYEKEGSKLNDLLNGLIIK